MSGLTFTELKPSSGLGKSNGVRTFKISYGGNGGNIKDEKNADPEALDEDSESLEYKEKSSQLTINNQTIKLRDHFDFSKYSKFFRAIYDPAVVTSFFLSYSLSTGVSNQLIPDNIKNILSSVVGGLSLLIGSVDFLRCVFDEIKLKIQINEEEAKRNEIKDGIKLYLKIDKEKTKQNSKNELDEIKHKLDKIKTKLEKTGEKDTTIEREYNTNLYKYYKLMLCESVIAEKCHDQQKRIPMRLTMATANLIIGSLIIAGFIHFPASAIIVAVMAISYGCIRAYNIRPKWDIYAREQLAAAEGMQEAAQNLSKNYRIQRIKELYRDEKSLTNAFKEANDLREKITTHKKTLNETKWYQKSRLSGEEYKKHKKAETFLFDLYDSKGLLHKECTINLMKLKPKKSDYQNNNIYLYRDKNNEWRYIYVNKVQGPYHGKLIDIQGCADLVNILPNKLTKNQYLLGGENYLKLIELITKEHGLHNKLKKANLLKGYKEDEQGKLLEAYRSSINCDVKTVKEEEKFFKEAEKTYDKAADYYNTRKTKYEKAFGECVWRVPFAMVTIGLPLIPQAHDFLYAIYKGFKFQYVLDALAFGLALKWLSNRIYFVTRNLNKFIDKRREISKENRLKNYLKNFNSSDSKNNEKINKIITLLIELGLADKSIGNYFTDMINRLTDNDENLIKDIKKDLEEILKDDEKTINEIIGRIKRSIADGNIHDVITVLNEKKVIDEDKKNKIINKIDKMNRNLSEIQENISTIKIKENIVKQLKTLQKNVNNFETLLNSCNTELNDSVNRNDGNGEINDIKKEIDDNLREMKEEINTCLNKIEAPQDSRSKASKIDFPRLEINKIKGYFGMIKFIPENSSISVNDSVKELESAVESLENNFYKYNEGIYHYFWQNDKIKEIEDQICASLGKIQSNLEQLQKNSTISQQKKYHFLTKLNKILSKREELYNKIFEIKSHDDKSITNEFNPLNLEIKQLKEGITAFNNELSEFLKPHAVLSTWTKAKQSYYDFWGGKNRREITQCKGNSNAGHSKSMTPTYYT